METLALFGFLGGLAAALLAVFEGDKFDIGKGFIAVVLGVISGVLSQSVPGFEGEFGAFWAGLIGPAFINKLQKGAIARLGS